MEGFKATSPLLVVNRPIPLHDRLGGNPTFPLDAPEFAVLENEGILTFAAVEATAILKGDVVSFGVRKGEFRNHAVPVILTPRNDRPARDRDRQVVTF